MSLRTGLWIGVVFLLLVNIGCESEQEKPKQKKPRIKTAVFKPVEKPNFSGDSAYAYVQRQVDFGPRVPDSKAHALCAEYLKAHFDQEDWITEIQLGEATTFNQRKIKIKNVIARTDTQNTNRVLLMAHWDSRPFADRDDTKKNDPILGANDGASGVGVLMEIARAITAFGKQPKVGIDIVLFDAEDYGQPSGVMGGSQTGDTWCLGSQYWAKQLDASDKKPKYGVLLDMVGAENAVFPKEGVSVKYNRELVDRVWYLAHKLGYANYFINDVAPGGITDDHLYVNQLAGIPSIDIIHYDPYKGDFGPFHHKHTDNMEIIHKETLDAVGTVVLELLYRE